jgi:hypothetical protein
MTIDISSAEHVVLRQILENKLSALMNELAHTDDRAYREYVRETLKTVEQLQAKLEASVTQGAPQRA